MDEAPEGEDFGVLSQLGSVKVRAPAVVLCVLFGLLAVGGVGFWLMATAEPEEPPPMKKVTRPPLGSLPPSTTVTLNPMSELDYLSREEIFAGRKGSIDQHPDLARAMVGETYEPSAEVFGDMRGGQVWWGALGLSHFGSGRRSVEGPSEQSRFVTNPYLLVGLREAGAYVEPEELSAEAVLVEPSALTLQGSPARGRATYLLAPYLQQCRERGRPTPDRFHLIAYNARDLGFTHYLVALQQSRDVDAWFDEGRGDPFAPPPPPDLRSKRPTAPLALDQWIGGRAGSLGFPGGLGNNICPYGSMVVQVRRLPAHATVLLWRTKPTGAEVPPDLVFTLDFPAGP